MTYSLAGELARAEALAADLNRRFPSDTQIQSLWLPTVRAQVALDRKNPAAALNELKNPSAIEYGEWYLSCVDRGQAYLAAGQGKSAADEFQKLIDRNGLVTNCWTGALAPLGAAPGNALQAKTLQGADADAARVRVLAAYKDFLSRWKDADPDIPILKEAKPEYRKLQ